jgi:putative ABC transport system substrate-binding protein
MGLPAAHNFRKEVEAGGLMSYGTDTLDTWRQVGIYTGQILQGAKPEMVINLNTAKALGLAIPPGVLAIADEVIE